MIGRFQTFFRSVVVITLLIVLSGCQAQTTVSQFFGSLFSKNHRIQIPENEAPVPKQWIEKGQQYVYVAVNNAPLYFSPEDEEPHDTLPVSKRLVATYKLGEFIFTRDFEGKEVGWLMRSSLAFPSDFTKEESWELGGFSACIGELCNHFEVFENGSFINRWTAKGDSIHMEGVEKGHFFRKNQLIYAKSKNAKLRLIFYEDDQGQLFLEQLYNQYPVVFDN